MFFSLLPRSCDENQALKAAQLVTLSVDSASRRVSLKSHHPLSPVAKNLQSVDSENRLAWRKGVCSGGCVVWWLARPFGGMVVLGGAAAYEVAWFEYFEVKVRPVMFLGGVHEVLRCISSFASLHLL